MNVLFQGGEQFFEVFTDCNLGGGECEHFFKVVNLFCLNF